MSEHSRRRGFSIGHADHVEDDEHEEQTMFLPVNILVLVLSSFGPRQTMFLPVNILVLVLSGVDPRQTMFLPVTF